MKDQQNVMPFSAIPTADLIGDLKRCAPSFRGLECSASQAYSIVRGAQPWLLTTTDEHGVSQVAMGTLFRGKRRCGLGVTIEAAAQTTPAFWASLHEFADCHDVTALWVESIGEFGSTASIPTLRNESQRFEGLKLYVLDLQVDTPLDGMTTNHRRNIARAERKAIAFVELPEAEALSAHVHLVDSSLARREARGEPTGDKLHMESTKCALASGMGRLYQASLSGNIVSSKLVVVIGEHAHYLYGGTSEEGMRLGASHFLMYQIMRSLKTAGVKTLNLDIASVGSGGLARFKEGFGGEVLRLDRAYADLASPIKSVRNFAHHLLRHGIGAGNRAARRDTDQED